VGMGHVTYGQAGKGYPPTAQTGAAPCECTGPLALSGWVASNLGGLL
jgi:hypothetical protein